MLGTVTSQPEVTHISTHGFWLLWADEELLLSFQDFPWFRNATVDQLTHVLAPSAEHLYWPELDVDVSLQSIRDPSAYPLIARPGSTGK